MKLTVLDEVASTNEIVKNALREGKAEGLVVRARRQSGGYGRQGRPWDSPEGGLYMSLLLRPDVAGSGLATLSLVSPAIIIIVIIAKFMSDFSENKYVRAAFYGIRPMIASLIGYAVWQIAVITFADLTQPRPVFHYSSMGICLVVFLLLQWKPLKKLHPILWIGCGAVLGIIFQL